MAPVLPSTRNPVVGGIAPLKAVETAALTHDSHRASQLRWLAVGWFCSGTAIGLFACLPSYHVMMAAAFLMAPRMGADRERRAEFMGEFNGPGAVGLLLTVIIVSRLVFYTCQSISTRKNYRFVQIMAILALLIPPIGTGLGIATLLLIRRPEVRKAFGVG